MSLHCIVYAVHDHTRIMWLKVQRATAHTLAGLEQIQHGVVYVVYQI